MIVSGIVSGHRSHDVERLVTRLRSPFFFVPVGLLAVVGAVALGYFLFVITAERKKVIAETKTFLAHVRAKNLAAAYAMASRRFEQQDAAWLRQVPAIQASTADESWGVTMDGHRACLLGYLVPTRFPTRIQVVVKLLNEGGHWKVSDLARGTDAVAGCEDAFDP